MTKEKEDLAYKEYCHIVGDIYYGKNHEEEHERHMREFFSRLLEGKVQKIACIRCSKRERRDTDFLR